MDDDDLRKLVRATGVELLERGELEPRTFESMNAVDCAQVEVIKELAAYLQTNLLPEVIAGALAGIMLSQANNDAQDAREHARLLVKMQRVMTRRALPDDW